MDHPLKAQFKLKKYHLKIEDSIRNKITFLD